MLTIPESFAVGAVLTEWPDAMSYDEVLGAIECDHPDIVTSELYEDEHPSDNVCTIEDLRVRFLVDVQGMTMSLRWAIREGDPETIAQRLVALEAQLGIEV